MYIQTTVSVHSEYSDGALSLDGLTYLKDYRTREIRNNIVNTLSFELGVPNSKENGLSLSWIVRGSFDKRT